MKQETKDKIIADMKEIEEKLGNIKMKLYGKPTKLHDKDGNIVFYSHPIENVDKMIAIVPNIIGAMKRLVFECD